MSNYVCSRTHNTQHTTHINVSPQTSTTTMTIITSINTRHYHVFGRSRHIRIAFLLLSGTNRGFNSQGINHSSIFAFALQSNNNKNTSDSFVSNDNVQFFPSRRSYCPTTSRQAKTSMAAAENCWSSNESSMRQDALNKCILPLSASSHKGSSGRIGVLGGSAQYTGAPYYAAMASLKTGANLAFVFCAQEAAIPIKSYSPELMVTAVYNAANFDQLVKNGEEASEKAEKLITEMVEGVKALMEKMHVLVIGPGLGRCPIVLEATSRIIHEARSKNLPLVLDADALFLLTLEKHQRLFAEELHVPVVLTPNAMELKRFKGLDHNWSTDCVFVEKGSQDTIRSIGGSTNLVCNEKGGIKRPGGLGDVLAGTLGTLVAWNRILSARKVSSIDDLPLSCWTACCMVKRATQRAFEEHRRSMTAPDVLAALGSIVNDMTIDLDRSRI